MKEESERMMVNEPVYTLSSNSWLLTRAREWGLELRAWGGGLKYPPPANSAPMQARITKFLWEVVRLKISIVFNFGDPRSVYLNLFDLYDTS